MAHRLLKSIRAAVAWITRTETQPFLLLVAACLLVGEQYPFSNFPMYSSFSESTYYVYLADESGTPLSTYATIGVSTATLKKMYETALRAEMRHLRLPRKQLTDEQRQVLGARFLASLRTQAAAADPTALPKPLRLYEVQVRLADGHLRRETRLIAEQR